MQDTKKCPICNMTLKNKNLPTIQRVCYEFNHYFLIYVNKKTNEVEYAKFTLNNLTKENITKYFEVDYLNNKSSFIYLKGPEMQRIYINKIIEPDFNNFEALLSKGDKYMILS